MNAGLVGRIDSGTVSRSQQILKIQITSRENTETTAGSTSQRVKWHGAYCCFVSMLNNNLQARIPPRSCLANTPLVSDKASPPDGHFSERRAVPELMHATSSQILNLLYPSTKPSPAFVTATHPGAKCLSSSSAGMTPSLLSSLHRQTALPSKSTTSPF
jgi:hypothetical protein